MGGNLTPKKFPFPDKCKDVREPWYLEKLHQYAVDEAENIISWYLKNKEGNKCMSKWIRFFTIFFIAFGGAFLLISTVTTSNCDINLYICNFRCDISLCGYIAIAIAGSLLLFDRCFGFTSSWVRFITAATTIQKLITEFEPEYLLLCSEKKGRCKKQLDRIRRFSIDVRNVVAKESAAWAAEYSSNLARLEGLLKSGPRDK